MAFLASIKPLLRGSSSVTVTISNTGDGLSVLLQPKLEKHDPDTTDTALATLQSALAQPIRVLIPANADPDTELQRALTRVNEHRDPVQDDLQAYLVGLAQAREEAVAAAAKAAEKKASKGKANKPDTKAPAPDEQAGGASDPVAAAHPAPSATVPEPAPMASLFD